MMEADIKFPLAHLRIPGTFFPGLALYVTISIDKNVLVCRQIPKDMIDAMCL